MNRSDTSCQEAKKNVVVLEEDDPLVVNAMLEFLYAFDYDDEVNKKDPSLYSPIVFNIHVSIIADKYDMSSLGLLAAKKFADHANAEWNKPTFADAVEVVYKAAPDHDRTLYETIVKVASTNATALYQHDFGARFREIAGSVPQLGSELAQKLSARLGMQWAQYKCRHCSCTDVLQKNEPAERFFCARCGNYSPKEVWYNAKVELV